MVIYIYANKRLWRLTKDEHTLYASRDDLTYKTRYNTELGVWELDGETVPQTEIEAEEDPFNHLCEMRYRRGLYLGKPCSDYSKPDSPVQSPSDLDLNHHVVSEVDTYAFTEDEKNIASRLDINLTPHSFRIDKMVFSDSWIIYRVRDEDKLSARVYHAVEIDKKLVPIKATAIRGHHFSCEIYDLKDSSTRHRVEFYKDSWRLEPSTSFYLSDELKDIIYHHANHKTSEDNEFLTKLSVPRHHGFQVDKNGHAYLRFDNRYVRIHNPTSGAFISAKNDGFIYIHQEGEKYKFSHALLERGSLELNAREMRTDMAMYSSQGLSNNQVHKLNYHWNLIHTNVKSSNYHNDGIIGSKIDIMLRMKYNPNTFDSFIEPPDIQWSEVIKTNDNGVIWMFSNDMYQHNRHSYTFYSWNNKYLLAYSFVKGERTNQVNEPVCFYDNEMQPLDPTALPNVYTNEEKISSVRNYLKTNGGILDISIIDYPKIHINDEITRKERLVKVYLGFLDEIIFSFNQGINLQAGLPRSVFVTTGTNIHLADGPVKSQPPDSVTRPRIKRS